MSTYKDHQNLIKKFKIDVQKEIPGIRLFDRHVGKFILVRFMTDLAKRVCTIKDWKKYLISINKTGMADCYALLSVVISCDVKFLIHIEFEFKTGKARQSKEQKVWQNFIEKNNGIYMVIREDYHNSIEELKKGLNVS